LADREHFVERELTIGAVRDDALARLEMELFAIEVNRDDVRLERHEVGDAADLRVGIRISPGRGSGLTDVAVATDSFASRDCLQAALRSFADRLHAQCAGTQPAAEIASPG